MGVIIQCNELILHSTYGEYNLIKQNFINGCKCYIQNTNNPKLHKLYGIYLFLYKNKFSPKKSFIIIQSIFKIFKFINFSKNIYELLCIFLYSTYTNKYIFIK